jgi:hypothetical protein
LYLSSSVQQLLLHELLLSLWKPELLGQLGLLRWYFLSICITCIWLYIASLTQEVHCRTLDLILADDDFCLDWCVPIHRHLLQEHSFILHDLSRLWIEESDLLFGLNCALNVWMLDVLIWHNRLNSSLARYPSVWHILGILYTDNAWVALNVLLPVWVLRVDWDFVKIQSTFNIIMNLLAMDCQVVSSLGYNTILAADIDPRLCSIERNICLNCFGRYMW